MKGIQILFSPCLPLVMLLLCGCVEPEQEEPSQVPSQNYSDPYLLVLGTVQDGGSPHIGCKKACCATLFDHPDISRQVVSLGIVDPGSQKTFLIEATPDFTTQIKALSQQAPFDASELPDGIFLTHAHIGHYTGLMYLGKEALNADQQQVYTMPRMRTFLETNGPWSQLVKLTNIKLLDLTSNRTIQLTPNLSITPFRVPHRDEFSETVGYTISGPNHSVMFIPDIDKWAKWDRDILKRVKQVDLAYLDGTFFDAAEINYRDISQIPHPFIIETMQLFSAAPDSIKDRIHFIHFNHTNPVLQPKSEASAIVAEAGFHVARLGDFIKL